MLLLTFVPVSSLILSSCLNFKTMLVCMDFEDVCDANTPNLDIQTICLIAALCSDLYSLESSIYSDIK